MRFRAPRHALLRTSGRRLTLRAVTSAAVSVGLVLAVTSAGPTGGTSAQASKPKAHTTAPMKSINAHPVAFNLPSGCVQSDSDANSVSCSWSYTGSTQTFTVPQGVTSVHVGLSGASGGTHGSDRAGWGGLVEGSLSVYGGEYLYLEVGGAGGSNKTAGWPNGGSGADGSHGNGCGGGGASTIINAYTGTALVAAGGGGGCGGYSYISSYGTGGQGGTNSGSGDGASGGHGALTTCGAGGDGGGHATPTAVGGGGNGGDYYNGWDVQCETGSHRGGNGSGHSGGDGRDSGGDQAGGGGGGGGGYYGGGGGGGGEYAGGGGGGGGGSNGWASNYFSATNNQGAVQNGNGTLNISYYRVPTTTTLRMSQSNIYPGQTITAYADVTPGTVDPDSTVSFALGNNAIACQGGLPKVTNGTASCTYVEPGNGGVAEQLIAYFSGDAGDQPSARQLFYSVGYSPSTLDVGSVTAGPNSLSIPITVTPEFGFTDIDGPVSVYNGDLGQVYPGCSNLSLPDNGAGQPTSVTCSLTGLDANTTYTLDVYYGPSTDTQVESTRIYATTTKQTSTTQVSVAPNSGTFGDSATVTAAVAANGATALSGKVTIYRTSSPVKAGTAADPSWTSVCGPTAISTVNGKPGASCSVNPPGGTDYYVATYSDDSQTTGSTSDSAKFDAAAATTATSMTVTGATSSGGSYVATVGDAVTFKASTTFATPKLLGTGAPVATIQLLEGHTVVCAALPCTVSTLGAGAHNLHAHYAGTADAAASDSGVTNLTVRNAAATLTVKAPSATAPAGQAITLNATLATTATSAGGGTVTFFDQAHPAVALCTVTLPSSRVATCQTTPTPGATIVYSATYTGDSVTGTVAGTLATYTAGAASSTTTVGTSPASPAYGSAVTITATVTSQATTPRAMPDGSVTFTSGGATLCSAVPVTSTSTAGVAKAVCSTSALHAGAHTVTASYAATAATTASSGSGQVSIGAAPTTTTITTTNAQTGVTASVIVTASGVVPTGAVTVHAGTANGAVKCTVTSLDSNGAGSCTFALPPSGTYTYVAVYAASGNDFAGSNGSVDDSVGAADQPCTGGFAKLWSNAQATPSLTVNGAGLGSLSLQTNAGGTCNQAASLTFTAGVTLFGTSLTGSGIKGTASQSNGLCLTSGSLGLPDAYHAGALTITSPICFDLSSQGLLGTLRGGTIAAGSGADTPFFDIPGIGNVGLTLTAGHTDAGSPTLSLATTVSGSSVSATMTATIAGDGSLSGDLTTSGLTVFGQALDLHGDFTRSATGAITSHVAAALAGPFALVTGVSLSGVTATLGTDGIAFAGTADLGDDSNPVEVSVSGAFTSLKNWTLHVTSGGASWTPVHGLTFTPEFDGTITSTAGEYDYDITAAGPNGKNLVTWQPGPGVSITVDSINLSNGDTACGSGTPALTMAGAVTAGPVDATLAGCVNLSTRAFKLTAAATSIPISPAFTLSDFSARIDSSGSGVSFDGSGTGHVDAGGHTLDSHFAVVVSPDGGTVIGAGVDLTGLGLPVTQGYVAYASQAQDSFDTGIPTLDGGSVISLPEGFSARGVVTLPDAVAATLSQGGFTVAGDSEVAFEASLSKTAGIKFHGELGGPAGLPFLTLPGGSTLNSAELDYADGVMTIGATASIANETGDPADAELTVTVGKDGSFSGDASVKGLLILGQSVDLSGTVEKKPGEKITASVTATVPGPVTIGSSVPVSLTGMTVTLGTSGLSFSGDISVVDSAKLTVSGEVDSLKHWSFSVVGDTGSWSPTDGVNLNAHLVGTIVHDASVAAPAPKTTVHLEATGVDGGNLFTISPTSAVTLSVTSIAIGNDAAPAACPSSTSTGDLYFAISGGLAFSLGSSSGSVDGAGCFDITQKTFQFDASVPSVSVSALGGTVHIDDLTVSIGRDISGSTAVFSASAEGRLTVNMPFGGQVVFTGQLVFSGGDFAIGASVDLSKYLGAKAASAYLYYSTGPVTLTVPNATIGKVTLAAGVTVALNLKLSADQTSLLSKIGLNTSSGVSLAAIGTIDFANKVVSLSVKLDLGIEGQTIFGTPSDNPSSPYMQFLSGGLQLTISPTIFSIGVRADVKLGLPAATPGGQASTVQLTGMFAVSNQSITVSLSAGRWLDAFGTAGLNLRFLAIQGGINFEGLPSLGFAASVDGLPSNVAQAIGYTQGAPITIALNLSADQFLLKLEIGTKDSGITALAPLTAVGAPDLIKVDYGLLYISPAGATIGTQTFSPGFEIALQAKVFGVSVDLDAKIDPVNLAIYFKADIGTIHLGALTMGPTHVLLDASVAGKRFNFEFSGSIQLGPGSVDIGPALKLRGSAHADVTVKIGTSGFAVHGNFDLFVQTSMYLPQDVCFYAGFLPYPCDYQWKDQSPLSITLNNLGFSVDSSGITLDVPNTTYSITLPFPGGAGSMYRANALGYTAHAAPRGVTTATDKAPEVKGGWHTTGSLTQGRSFAATAAVPGGALVAGGASGATVLSSAERYDSATGRWSATAAMPRGVAAPAQVTLGDGTVLVIGGATADGPVTDVQAYHPSSGTWSVLAPMGTARQGATATLLGDGSVLVVGGRTGSSSATSSAQLYHPASNTWTDAAAMPGARTFAASARLSDGTVLVAGGVGAGGPLRSAAVYHPSTNTWSSAGALQVPRFGASIVALHSGGALVTGGAAQAELYHPATHRFSTAGLQSVSQQFGSAVALTDGRVLSLGGVAGGRATAISQVYSPGTNSWAPAQALPGGRAAAGAVRLGTGNVLVAGGSGPTGLRSAGRSDAVVFALPHAQHVPDGSSNGSLADTGVKASPPAWLLIGSSLILLGAVLVLGGRRRRVRG